MSIYDNVAFGPRTHGIRSKVQLDEIVEKSLRDAAIWDELIFNLCDNAVKYNKPGGTIKVSVLMEDEHPVLSVEDNGIGIPESEWERIFERVYRVDKSHSKQIGGTIVYRFSFLLIFAIYLYNVFIL